MSGSLGALVARDDILDQLAGGGTQGVAVLGSGASLLWTDPEGATFTVTVTAHTPGTPFVESDVLLAVLEGDQAAARALLAPLDPAERRELWRVLVLAATLCEQAGLEPEPDPPSGPRSLRTPTEWELGRKPTPGAGRFLLFNREAR